MATTEQMNQDDDVERLFSWLQTPDLRYREFAGAREVTDTVVLYQGHANTPEIEALSSESLPQEPDPAADPYGYQTEEAIVPPPLAPPMRQAVIRETVTRETVTREAAVREPAMIAPTVIPAAPAVETGPFALGAAGREASRPPEIARPSQAAAPPEAPSPPPAPIVRAGGGLLGGAYREGEEGGQDATSSNASQQQQARSLDAVFGRLGNSRPPDPRERLRHIPGLGPPASRPR